ncbi:nucleoside triphosphate pyrophosphohydrolase [uncultured Bartonella sp.]|uniref:nucleoside triphosphate pyrophosphohydrolase n=1 Tax=uncultured Bartonella sp. TaxID=104108 RepID=UPI00262E483C|nr:nucleoside triphosphate pyrophosphohydrolase [uncultured Bartonella sp.]
MKPSKDIRRLNEIMAALRDRETGCPWDKIQDFKTIIPYTIDEVYEVIDAINRNDKYDLCEELGDLLLQVVYYARMAEEEGSFNFDDVVYAITEKMIRRHPHVFGNDKQKQTGLIDEAWQRIKAQEKTERRNRRTAAGLPDDTPTGFLSDVKTAQPLDKEAIALQKKAAQIGFDWSTPKPIFDKFDEELAELKTALHSGDHEQIEQEFGDVYFTLLNLARKLNLSPDQCLAKANKKFRYRFGFIEHALNKNNKSLDKATLNEMEDLWNEAKLTERKK